MHTPVGAAHYGYIDRNYDYTHIKLHPNIKLAPQKPNLSKYCLIHSSYKSPPAVILSGFFVSLFLSITLDWVILFYKHIAKAIQDYMSSHEIRCKGCIMFMYQVWYKELLPKVFHATK